MTMAASHAADKKLRDAIFGATAACNKAGEKHGLDKVTNATIGMMMNDEGGLAVLPTVEKVYRNLQTEEMFRYAPIAGLPAYLAEVESKIEMPTFYEEL